MRRLWCLLRPAPFAKACWNPTVSMFRVCSPKLCSTFTERRLKWIWNRIEGNWKQLKGKIKEKWGHLTDDDLHKIAGRRERMEDSGTLRFGRYY
jgi:uncharacterized protein YjbJ (UPF0337 family)